MTVGLTRGLMLQLTLVAAGLVQPSPDRTQQSLLRVVRHGRPCAVAGASRYCDVIVCHLQSSATLAFSVSAACSLAA
jgi:hypothetical protein